MDAAVEDGVGDRRLAEVRGARGGFGREKQAVRRDARHLVGGGEAPAWVCWGHNNRSALLRVPMYKPEKGNSTRIEYRAMDSAANPYLAYALLLSLIVGVFQFLLGALRLGLVVNFLSHPVVNGFTNAGALIIFTSQLEKMFGVYVDGAEHHYETIL